MEMRNRPQRMTRYPKEKIGSLSKLNRRDLRIKTPFVFFFKIIIFPKKKKKLIKSRFSKVMHLSLKLVASAMPYSLFLEQVKITHLFSKKKSFSKKSCISFQTRGIQLCLIQVSTNHIKRGKKSSNFLLQDLIKKIKIPLKHDLYSESACGKIS